MKQYSENMSRLATAAKLIKTSEAKIAARKLHDLAAGLQAVRAKQDPQQTAQHNALKYRTQFDRAQSVAISAYDSTLDKLVAKKKNLISEARAAAGIANETANSAEIRAALRAMPQAERDATISEGDPSVIAAILNQPRVLTGRITAPVDGIVDRMCESAKPGFKAELEQIASDGSALEMSRKAFQDESESLRDLRAENDAAEAAKAAQAADQKYQTALEADV